MAANDVPCCEPMFWVYLIICVALVAFAGLMSGLTLGLMSLSLVDLEVLARAGKPNERKNAAKILPIVKNQHLLLCTLLIGNSMAMEALPIFIDALLPAWGAIVISVTLILVFGEIIPQAVCARYGLSVGAKLSVVVQLLVLILFPLSYPISKLLDLLLGKRHSALLRRAELKTFVDMHGNKEGKGGELTNDETTIITGALDMTLKTAKDAMTPLCKIFSLDINSKLDEKTMGLIMSKGHSRVPIYSVNPANIVGLILVKNLIKYRPEDETPIRDLTIRKIPRVLDNLPLYDILNQFQMGQSHMAVVVKSNKEVKETAGNIVAQTSLLEVNFESNSKERQAHTKGISQDQYCKNEKVDISLSIPSVTFIEPEVLHTKSKSLWEQGYNLNAQMKISEPGDDIYFDGKSVPDLEEDIVGIITLEDVMEELLQEEILDETDEYVAVHNKLKINMIATRRSPYGSPGTASASHLRCSSPMTSPHSSYHQSSLSSYNNTPPILHSPLPSSYIQSPLTRPTLSTSPAKYTLKNSPTDPTHASTSPSSHKVSRKAYEKLRHPSGS